MSDTTDRPVHQGPLRVTRVEDDAVWRVCLARPKPNLLDVEMIHALREVFERARDDHKLKVVLLEGEGGHFSFGASVEEHLPGKFESMIPEFHGLFDRMLESSVVTLAAVRGLCLGGALELASFCHRVFAAPEARLGQPEIVLGVFPPVASVALAERIGRSRAEDLCLTGRTLTGEEAQRIGLVDELAHDPAAAALAYAHEHLIPRSASSLRLAVRACREAFADRFRADLQRVERLYVEDLMKTHDANEGLRAFLDKREPAWSDS